MDKLNMTFLKLSGIIIISIVVGMGLSMFFSSGDDTALEQMGEREVLYWVAPMDPNYRRDQPGKSPMGMDLEPVYANGASSDEDVVIIAASTIQNIGVRSEQVRMGPLSRNIETVGFIGFDEEHVSHIHVRSRGWIEELSISAEGEAVAKGDLLFRFYSPDIANAKAELVQAYRVGNRSLIDASKARLLSLAVPQSQIDHIEATGEADNLVDVFSPQDGVVAKLNVAEGMHIEPGTTVISLADLSKVWLNAEVFEDDAPWLKEQAVAHMQVPFLPERVWQGRVDYVYPTIDPKTRTIRARIEFDNSDLALKPNMYANVHIEGEVIMHALSIPREALIQTGSSTHVIEALSGGRFKPHSVVVGIESGDKIQILSGLTAGMQVVTSGQFLLDSEASLSGAFARMGESDDVDMEPEMIIEPEMNMDHDMDMEPEAEPSHNMNHNGHGGGS